LFYALRSRSHMLLLPRFRGETIEWVPAKEWSDLEAGRFGILEPTTGASETLRPIDVAVLPGLAFDRNGWRLGRGGGHYDRAFPPETSSPWLIGVGYSFQWRVEVPHDSHDRRVDAIVTENGWVLARAGATLSSGIDDEVARQLAVMREGSVEFYGQEELRAKLSQCLRRTGRCV
jgi:5-formyltetrahydrofolate cyclo-ligase